MCIRDRYDSQSGSRNTGSMWWTLSSSSAEWIRFDLGQNRDIQSVVIQMNPSYGANNAGCNIRANTADNRTSATVLFNNIDYATGDASPFTWTFSP